MRIVILLTGLLMAGPVAALEPVRICMSAGNEAEGVTAMMHSADDSAIRVDSPYSDDPQSRVRRWREPGYFAALQALVEPALSDLPEDALAGCDDGWRDTLVVTYDDGTTARWDASCVRNPVAQLRNLVAARHPSFAENVEQTRTGGPIEGVYDPCGRDW